MAGEASKRCRELKETVKGTVEGYQAQGEMMERQNFMYRIFGFRLSDILSLSQFIKLINRPVDPAALGVLRFLFGLLMVMDTPQERGLSKADDIWGDKDKCRFPLFDVLQPLPLEWMFILYFFMWIGAVGIMLGLFYRFSCLVFSTSYWYLFLLDKMSWNNHSYLFGLHALLFLLMDGNRYWSLDGFRNHKLRNAEVPLWNYTLLRFQIFLVYFIAGLKKLDRDWLQGYSVQALSTHWVFIPFTWLMTEQQVDLYIVHLGGFVLDLTVGFFLFFDGTRPYAIFFCTSFHLMNSQIFTIGMFPWLMLATMPIFCHANWPRNFFKKFPRHLQFLCPVDGVPQPSSHCLYKRETVKPEEDKAETVDQNVKAKPVGIKDKPGFYHKATATFTVCYILIQCFLPYSHFLTKGYNNWTNGLYGYSWDMMVHSWNLRHISISYTSKQNKTVKFLEPTAFVDSENTRWAARADSVKQYAHCLSNRLEQYNVTVDEIYFDIWISLSKRFAQRVFDPTVDMLTAEWGIFQPTPWLLPLQQELSDWRMTLQDITKSVKRANENVNVVFFADFPGFDFEIFIQKDLGETNITVLKGALSVSLEQQEKEVYLQENETLQLPFESFHTVKTVSAYPACFMYTYINTTEMQLQQNISRNSSAARDDSSMIHAAFKDFTNFLRIKLYIFYRSLKLSVGALYSVIAQQPFDTILNSTITVKTFSREIYPVQMGDF